MRHVGRGTVLDVRPDVAEGARDDALALGGTLHGVRLARARLPVREHAPVEPVQHRRHQRPYLHHDTNVTNMIVLGYSVIPIKSFFRFRG